MAQVEKIARSLYEHWNKREFDKIESLYDDDCEIVIVGSDTRFRGRSGALEFERMWADAFPDGKVTIDKVVTAGDCAVVEYTGTGTQTGKLRTPGGDIEATGRSVTLRLCDVMEFRGERIRALRTYFDSAALLMQLGVMPETQAVRTA